MITDLTAPAADIRTKTAAAAPNDRDADAVAARVFAATLGAMETLVDLPSATASAGTARWPTTDPPPQANSPTGPRPRPATPASGWRCRRWYGLLDVVEETGDAATRRFALSPAVAEVMLDLSSTGAARAGGPDDRRIGGSDARLPDGLPHRWAGVSWEELGEDARQSQADLNRPWADPDPGGVPPACRRSTPGVTAPGARIADIGCGAGWSTIAMAQAHPRARFVGLDIDGPSVAQARVERGGAGRGVCGAGSSSVSPTATSSARHGRFDPDPPRSSACTTWPGRWTCCPRLGARWHRTGSWVVEMDEAVAGTSSPHPGTTVERMMYGYSMFVCLPDGLSSQPSVGTGTVMRRSTLAGYAGAAGFASVSRCCPVERLQRVPVLLAALRRQLRGAVRMAGWGPRDAIHRGGRRRNRWRDRWPAGTRQGRAADAGRPRRPPRCSAGRRPPPALSRRRPDGTRARGRWPGGPHARA